MREGEARLALADLGMIPIGPTYKLLKPPLRRARELVNDIFVHVHSYFCELSGNHDGTLFKFMLINSHSCIHQLLPSAKNENMQLQPRGHKSALPV